MNSNLVISLVSSFLTKEGKPSVDKNGKNAMFLKPIAGSTWSKALVISGTIAERMNLVEGNIYLIQVDRKEDSVEFGAQFNHTKLGVISPIELLLHKGTLGEAKVIELKEPITKVEEEVKVDSKEVIF